jgi:Fur family transcriptional regulator, ferric uptake regulator
MTTPDLHATLKAKGYRLTPQRQLVLDAVARLGHGTPDEICAEVQRSAPGVNLSTVYRTLELLEELGLVSHTHLSHGSPTYHSAGEDQHVHLVCRACRSITEVDPSVLQPVTKQLQQEQDFRVDVGHVSLFGVCGNCKELP